MSKITVNRHELFKALQVVQKAVPARSPLPVLFGALLVSDGKRLNVTATDLNTEIRVTLPCQGDGFSTVLPAKMLAELLRFLDDETIIIEQTVAGAVVHYAGNAAKIRGFPADQFPSELKNEHLAGITVKAGVLKDAFQRVAFAASDDLTAPVFTNICVELEKQSMRFITTDRYQIASLTIDVQRQEQDSGTVFLLPKPAVRNLVAALGTVAEEEEAVVSIDTSKIEVQAGPLCVGARLFSGAKFPPVKQILETPVIFTANIDKDRFLDVLRRADVFAVDDKNKVNQVIKLSFSGDEISVFCESEKGEMKEAFPISIEKGEDLQCTFQIKFLIGAVSHAKSKEITFNTCALDPLPCALITDQEGDYKALILQAQQA